MGFFSRIFGFGKRKPKFEVGDTVRCIDDRNHTVKFGKEYIVKDRVQLSCCGDFCYDVGLDCFGYTNCTTCTQDIPGKGIRWAGEFRFAPVVKAKERAKAENSIEIKNKEILKKEAEYIGVN